MNIKKKQNSNFVCIIGLGFVGLTLSIAMTNGGFKVFGVEKNKYILKKLREKKGHFYEPGLDKFLKQNLKRKKFSFSNFEISASYP